MWLMQNGMANPNNIGAAAYTLHDADRASSRSAGCGCGWRAASAAALAAGEGDRAFHEAKLVTARFFAERILPDAGALRRKIEGGARER